jgi:hypothetical protein
VKAEQIFDTTYRPAELVRFQRWLRIVYLISSPKTPGSMIRATVARTQETPIPDADGMRQQWRDYLERLLEDLRRKAQTMDKAITVHGRPPPPEQGRRSRSCPSCRARQREAARWCDSCGAGLRGQCGYSILRPPDYRERSLPCGLEMGHHTSDHYFGTPSPTTLAGQPSSENAKPRVS